MYQVPSPARGEGERRVNSLSPHPALSRQGRGRITKCLSREGRGRTKGQALYPPTRPSPAEGRGRIAKCLSRQGRGRTKGQRFHPPHARPSPARGEGELPSASPARGEGDRKVNSLVPIVYSVPPHPGLSRQGRGRIANVPLPARGEGGRGQGRGTW